MTPEPYRVLFIVDPDDKAERSEVAKASMHSTHLRHITATTFPGSWAEKINRGVQITDEPLLFLGADDLDYQVGWLEAATRLMPEAQVVGTNDLIPRPHKPDHATHFLMTRAYAEEPTIDDGPGPACELYDHCFVDNELIDTARHRGTYAYAEDSVVEHLHPMAKKAPDDAVYAKGMSTFRSDGRLYRKRRALWRSAA